MRLVEGVERLKPENQLPECYTLKRNMEPESLREKIQEQGIPRGAQKEKEFLRNVFRERLGNANETTLDEAEKAQIGRDLMNEYHDTLAEMDDKVYIQTETKELPRDIAQRLDPEKHDEVMMELYQIVETEGVAKGIDTAEELNNPHILDDFHRFLIAYIDSRPERISRETTPINRALGMRLFEVELPRSALDEKNDFREMISRMQQFFAGMQAIGGSDNNAVENYFSVEIAVPAGSDKISFFIGVPVRRADLLEKQILGAFPDLRIIETFNDFNIFAEDGVEAASFARAKERDIFPIKTFDEMGHDPIGVVLNTFANLDDQTEGAALQLICVPAGDTFIKKYGKVLDQLKKGKKLKEAMLEIASFEKRALHGIGGLIFSNKKDEEEKEIDQDAVEKVTKKLASSIVNTNIRIATSASNTIRAKEILSQIESSFLQYQDPRGGEIVFESVTGMDLKNILNNFVYRIFSAGESLRMNLQEIATIFHFPFQIESATHQLTEDTGASAPLSSNAPTSGLILGRNTYRGRSRNVFISPEDRLRHMYVIGQTGTGKTHLLRSMIYQDIMNGNGACFIDPHGSEVEEILKYIPRDRINDVIYFDPAYTPRPFGLNMLEYDHRFPEQKTFVINELIAIFEKLFDMRSQGGPIFGQFFRNSTGLMMEDTDDPGTLLEISRVLQDTKYREYKLAKSKNPIINQFWQNAVHMQGEQSLENFVPYITSKFDQFISNEIMRPIVAQKYSSFNFRQAMDERKILLLNLSKGRLGEVNAHMLGMILVGKILNATLSRVDTRDLSSLAPFYLYIDEFQNVTTDSIAQIFAEARKFGLSLTVAHQYIGQLETDIRTSIFGNVGSKVVFRVENEDAEYFDSTFSPTFSTTDVSRLPNRHALVKMLGHGKPLPPFSLETLAIPENAEDLSEEIKQNSYQTYGRDRNQVEAEILERYNQSSGS